MAKTHTRTVRLQLFVEGDATGDKNAARKRLREIHSAAWRAANEIVRSQYFNDVLMRKLYDRLDIDRKDMTQVQDAENRFTELFGVKRQATSERDIKQLFPELPSCVTNQMNNEIVSAYKKEKREMLSGRRSLRTYKDKMPVSSKKVAVSFSKDDEGKYHVTWKLGRSERISFGIYFGQDRANNRLTIDRILSGEYSHGAPSFQLKETKWFLLLPVQEPEKPAELDPKICVGVDLGLAIPAFCAVSNSPQRKPLGDREDFLKIRLQLQSRRRRLQRSLVSAHGGKGRKRKLKALNDLKQKERNFVSMYNHRISKHAVDFAVRNRAGTIKLEMLEGYGQEEKKGFILRNWSYFELQNDVKYKAAQYGINVIFIDPYHTSQKCSQCGNYEPDQRISQSEFVCKKCEAKLQADYNAALNIANSKEVVTKKEECKYYKQQQEEPAEQSTAAGHSAEG